MVTAETEPNAQLSAKDRLDLLRLILESRHGDLREERLMRQGKGWFQISGAGHEAFGAIGYGLGSEDYIFPYYRDRALVLAKGVTTRELALGFFAKKDSSSRGRQLPGHFSHRERKVWSLPSPVGAHFLPACGLAWGLQLDGKDSVVVVTTGEGAARQGDFHEAICFAEEHQLPILFVVEDNGISISARNSDTTPLSLGVLAADKWIRANGSEIESLGSVARNLLTEIRAGGGPRFLWAKTPRLSSHSSADDHRQYLSAEELSSLEDSDPVERYKRLLVSEGVASATEIEAMDEEARESARQDYDDAYDAEDPDAADNERDLFGEPSSPEIPSIALESGGRMLEAVNKVFHTAVETNPDFVFFGQDVEDPKGGVFKLTKNLSETYPKNVFNAPVAESTIVGVACGLASYGKRPVFELQFVDFVAPGWNQVATNLSTLRWRSGGEWSCPMVIYAPYGAFLPAGGPWHSQANEAAFAHLPGLRVVVPSTPADAAGLLWTAMQGNDPVIFLLPKHLLWERQNGLSDMVEAVPLGSAKIRHQGSDLTIVSWGNCVEIVEKAMEQVGEQVEVELIDLRSIVPWDRDAVFASVRKTGRVLVVQEDVRSCGVGQMILSEISEDSDTWNALQLPPKLISRKETHIGFNPIYEYDALPDSNLVAKSMLAMIADEGGELSAPSFVESQLLDEMEKPPKESESTMEEDETLAIRVPTLGEGIRNARVVSLSRNPGDIVYRDDPLCEIETDKAIFPIEAPVNGEFIEWFVVEDEEVEVGQKVARVRVSKNSPTPAVSLEKAKKTVGTVVLSPEALERMSEVARSTLEMQAGWSAIRVAREEAKEKMGTAAPTPSMIGTWCVARAMETNQAFASAAEVAGFGSDSGAYDLGFAVALEGDGLETAVIPRACRLSFDEFRQRYTDAVDLARRNRAATKARTPLIISSLGGRGVRSAVAVVAPPSIGTLFVGSSHWEPESGPEGMSLREVVRLNLAFDHRWMNGVGATSFVADIRDAMETFGLPEMD
jgi:2-oxoisovalerate dehydrogenase E1 component